MKFLGTRVQAAILRAVAAEGGLDGTDREKPMMTVESACATDWASATFVGALHKFDVRITGDAAAVGDAVQRLVAGLADRDIPISGQIVAEIGVVPGPVEPSTEGVATVVLAVTALTIID